MHVCDRQLSLIVLGIGAVPARYGSFEVACGRRKCDVFHSYLVPYLFRSTGWASRLSSSFKSRRGLVRVSETGALKERLAAKTTATNGDDPIQLCRIDVILEPQAIQTRCRRPSTTVVARLSSTGFASLVQHKRCI